MGAIVDRGRPLVLKTRQGCVEIFWKISPLKEPSLKRGMTFGSASETGATGSIPVEHSDATMGEGVEHAT